MLGKFIVFEGGEGAGKTTQLNLVFEWLTGSGWTNRIKGYIQGDYPSVLTTREPGGTALGKSIRKLLLDVTATGNESIDERAELLLFAADRAQHVSSCLLPHLQQGALVLCDRYTDSTIAYQGYGRELDLTLIHQLNQIATQGLVSDLTFWLDIDPEFGLARTHDREQDPEIETDRMEANEIAFHQRLRQGFADLARQHPERIFRIEAHQSDDVVAQQIQGILESRLQEWYP
ncbi:dTMP kinase [Acaryochloris marina]|uniref:Thymidylate kinase n=1 Tax=Acaryochloris marina (strain MBIC 11017) TaxID=329726 RepID=KTHY_ACAM1|nr:dTMP kinase [Acaryochloris marina]B0C3N6.1 RecName: Full=Thymidylate kinase; AltName: Full=dTMP kinase [Acaryochloris marina MBIC11017]ABW30973.1 thymidylate kinase [Acaryochloris marina MBIC11017]